jgi:hypothetical protein
MASPATGVGEANLSRFVREKETKMIKRLLLAGLLLSAIAGGASAQVISDGDFANWTTDSSAWFGFGTGGTATGTVDPTGGNPGARFLSDLNETGFMIVSQNLKTDYTNTAALTGDSYTLTIDAMDGPAGSPFQNFGLLIQQGGSMWAGAEIGVLNPGASWTPYSVSSVFNPGNFTLMNSSPASPATPSFAAGVATQFGFFTHQQQGGGHYEMYYDNFHLSSSHLDSTVPEPGAVALLTGVGFTGAAFIVRRKRRKLA